MLISPIQYTDHTNIKFDFEDFIKEELGLDLDSFTKREDEPVCKYFLKGTCTKGGHCPFKHKDSDRDKLVVCKHWLRGLCKKGDRCEFLHVFNMKKMPECWFYSKYGECCNGDECMYLHIDPESKQKECPWYARGFCKHGPHCRHKHVRKLVCQNYLTGFCPDGLNCSNGHPKYELPLVNTNDDSQHQQQQGHSQNSHRQHSNGQSYQQQHGQQPFLGQQHQQRFGNSDNRQGFQQQQQQQQQRTPFRKLEDVTCYKCGEQGHYANKCPNGRAGGGGGGP